MISPRSAVLLAIGLVSCAPPPPSAPAPSPPAATTRVAPSRSAPAAEAAGAGGGPTAVESLRLVARPIPLPGGNGPASLDFIFYERARSRVWVPAGSTGSVDVLDTTSGVFTRIEGFATAEREGRGKKRIVGPSAGAIGDGFAYIGNRATSEVCPVDVTTLKAGKCVKMSSGTDGVVYVAPSKEVWVTLPKAQTVAVLDSLQAGRPQTEGGHRGGWLARVLRRG
jgi:hypothetical protein